MRVWPALWLTGSLAAVLAASQAAEPARSPPLEIIYVNDGADYMGRGLAPSAEGLHRVVDGYADAGHTLLIYGVRSGVLTFNYRSKLPGEYFGEGYSDEALREHAGVRRMRDLLKASFERGLDPFGEVVARARARGVRILAQIRPNNFNPSKTNLDRVVNGRFYYEHPEYRIPGHFNWDYGRPEVRRYFLDATQEILDRYDVDGLDIDFTQQPPYFAEAEPNKAGLMNAFVRDVRERLDRAGQARGRRMWFTAGVRTTPPDLRWKPAGLDLRTWAREGLIDLLAVYAFGEPGGVPGLRDVGEYLEMCKGTRCRFLIAHAHEPQFRRAYPWNREFAVLRPWELTQQYFAAAERAVRAVGADGVLYRNYQIYPAEPRISDAYREYRSMNVNYAAATVPERAANIWIASAGGVAVAENGVLRLSGNRNYHRDPDMLSSGGDDLTVEAIVRVGNADDFRDCLMEAANGRRHAVLELFPDRIRLSEPGLAASREARLDLRKYRLLRLTLDSAGRARVYAGGVSPAVLDMELRNLNPYWRIAFGNGAPQAHSDWKGLYYTLDGAFAPAERRLAPAP